MDEQWFRERLAQLGKSIRGWAGHIGIDPSQMVRLLKGRRDTWTTVLSEIDATARYLEVSPEVVLARAGLKMSGSGWAPEAQTIEKDGKPTFAVLTWDDWQRVKMALGSTEGSG